MTTTTMRGAPPAKTDQVTLANWRDPGFNRWAFHHVREIVPSARIAATPGHASAFEQGDGGAAIPEIVLPAGQGAGESIRSLIEGSFTDGFLVLHKGRVIFDWFDPACPRYEPHIVFSVSKSLTATLAGILVESGDLDPESPVTRYIPEVDGSAYGECTVRHVLDMTVALDFEENYLDASGAFNRYRKATAWNPLDPGDDPVDLRSFLAGLPRADRDHGEMFHYASPNSDLLGWIVERASGARFSDLFSELIWQPLGAVSDGYVTVDRLGAPRTAGGICVTLDDLARFAEMMRQGGAVGARQIVPESWVADLSSNGDPQAWQRGTMTEYFPAGQYRSKWYQNGSGAFAAIGIHGQWIFIDPAAELTMVRIASQPEPVNDPRDLRWINAFTAIAGHFS